MLMYEEESVLLDSTMLHVLTAASRRILSTPQDVRLSRTRHSVVHLAIVD
jgi:hypothetical protein